MIRDEVLAVERWAVPERRLQAELLSMTESVFVLSSGHIGLCGNLDEEPVGTPATYLNAFFEARSARYAEAGHGDPEDGQTLIDVTNDRLLRLDRIAPMAGAVLDAAAVRETVSARRAVVQPDGLLGAHMEQYDPSLREVTLSGDGVSTAGRPDGAPGGYGCTSPRRMA